MKRIPVLLLLLQPIWAFGSHGRAGEITYKCLDAVAHKYEITVTTYTKTESCTADKCSLLVRFDYGNGDVFDSLWVQRTNGIQPCPVSPYCNEPACQKCGEVLQSNPNVKKNEYTFTYIFPGPGSYKIWMDDPTRNNDVLNIPNPGNVYFYIESKLVISGSAGCNNSPVLENPPIDNGCVGQVFEHHPGAWDPDGDSLAYSIVECLGANGQPIFGYTFPNAAPNCVGGTLNIDPNTGLVTWDSPVCQGEFNLCILIKEYRKIDNVFVLLGTVRRDMQIIIGQCSHDKPQITLNTPICVTAGNVIQETVTATDPDGGTVTLTGTGEPLNLANSPAVFTQPVSNTGAVSSDFYWQTTCLHVRKAPYYMVFRAEDDNPIVSLVDYETMEITIVGPPPEGLSAIPNGNVMELDWQPSVCSNATGYKVYRRTGPSGWTPAYCETGVPAYTGFARIATMNGAGSTSFTDNNNGSGLIHGQQYCYRVIAYFDDGAESYASDEVCAELKKDVPVITHVTVLATDKSAGADSIVWAKPTEMNDTVFPGPYHYKVYGNEGYENAGQYLGTTNTHAVLDSVDTFFVHLSIDTKNSPHVYRIELYSDSVLAGQTHEASSVYLNSIPSDNQLRLHWQENVPWTNTGYDIYRETPSGSGSFSYIGTSYKNEFSDSGLVNGKEYCYYVMSIGSYSAQGFINPIYNNSQIHCGIPVDTTAPCPPASVLIYRNCNLVENTLEWNNPNNSCSDDVVGYRIYYTPVLGGDLEYIASVSPDDNTTFLHTGISSVAGCYAVTAVDSFQNESAFSAVACTDNCPMYELPNVFTPGGDGINDLFKPFPYKFVESIELQIFNRWGQLVYETTDPNINWNGEQRLSKQPCNAGVYYYVCKVHELRLTGIEARYIKGYVQILYERDTTPAK